MPLACWPVLLPSPVQILLVRHVRNKNLGGHLFPHSLCIGDPRKRLDLPEQLAGLLLRRKRLTALLTAKVAFVPKLMTILPLLVEPASLLSCCRGQWMKNTGELARDSWIKHMQQHVP